MKICKFLTIYSFISFIVNGITLNSITGVEKLENFNKIQNIEVNKILPKNKLERREDKKIYSKEDNLIYTGAMYLKKDKVITAIYFYKDGQTEGNTYEYYLDGKLKFEDLYNRDVIQKGVEYRQNGTLYRTFNATEGLNGIRTIYYENGKDVKTVVEVTQDYSQKGKIQYILNGKLKAYNKQGHLKAILNFKNDSIAGLPQEMYYPNGKLKYYAIAKDNNQKNPTFTEKAISYYDNGQEKENCDEVDRGVWMCKKYDKNGKFKGEVQKGGQPIETSNFWANFFMGVLNILLQ